MAETKKISKKSFFEVNSSITSTKISLYATSPSELNGKIVLLDLTRMLRGKNLQLKLRIKEETGVLTSEPISVELLGSYIRRMIRGGIDYVEDSFEAECKDKKAIIKPFMITRKKVSRAVRQQIREISKKHLEAYLKARTTGEMFNELITNKVQRELSLKIKRVYPLALFEIRIFKVVEEKQKPAT